MATSGDAKVLILITLIVFGLAVLGNYYATVLPSTEKENDKTKIANFVAALTCALILIIGLDVEQSRYGYQVGVKGKGYIYALLLASTVITIIVTTIKTWANCKGSDDECQKGNRLGFYVMSGLSVMFLLTFFVIAGKGDIKRGFRNTQAKLRS